MMGVGQPAQNLSPLFISPNFPYLPKSISKTITFYSPIYWIIELCYFWHNTIPPFLFNTYSISSKFETFDFPHCPCIPNRVKFCHLLIRKFRGSNSSYHPIRLKICILVGTHYWMETGRKASQWICPHVRLVCSFEFFGFYAQKTFQWCTLFERMNFKSFAFAFGSYGTGSLVSRFRLLGRVPLQLTLSSCKKGFQCTSDTAPPKNKRKICNRSHNLTIWGLSKCTAFGSF
jgi:hypothetical protein